MLIGIALILIGYFVQMPIGVSITLYVFGGIKLFYTLAETLIAANIGDVSSLIVENEVLRRGVDNLMRTLEEGAEEYEAEKHRAEVAEQKATAWKDFANKWQKYYKEQAEREIEEGKKDE